MQIETTRSALEIPRPRQGLDIPWRRGFEIPSAPSRELPTAKRAEKADSPPPELASGDREVQPTDPKKLWEACREFESVFLAVLLREMRQTAQMEGGLLPHSVQEQTLQELFEGETARSLSGRAGLGLADLLHSYLTQNSPSVTDSGFRIRDSGFRPRREGRSPVLEA